MPQTRFVLSKALECGLQPIVVINKIDRPDARPNEVLDEVFDLFLQLGADDRLADFPHIYASSKLGFATHELGQRGDSVAPLMDMILEKIPGPEIDAEAPLQMLVTTLDWSDYVGRIAIGRIYSGEVKPGMDVALMQKDDKITPRGSSRSTSSRTWAAPRSSRPRPATSSPWWGWRTSRSAIR